MADLKLVDISEKMRDIDFAMLSTRTASGAIAARPMSNNRQVEYDGDNFFFTYGDTGTVRDIENDPSVGLGYQGKSGALGMKPFFITVEGKAELIRDLRPGAACVVPYAERLLAEHLRDDLVTRTFGEGGAVAVMWRVSFIAGVPFFHEPGRAAQPGLPSRRGRSSIGP